MRDKKVLYLVQAALLGALCFALTKAVVIPVPTGYVNLGDCAVLLSAWLLGPLYGGLAAGVGTALADVLSGYASYAPATFVIKAAMAAVAAVLFQKMARGNGVAAYLPGAVAAECIMVAGYFIYESLVLGVGFAAAVSVPANVMQGVAGVVAGVVLISALEKSGLSHLKEYM